jgi:signal transduction histidine kinase
MSVQMKANHLSQQLAIQTMDEGGRMLCKLMDQLLLESKRERNGAKMSRKSITEEKSFPINRNNVKMFACLSKIIIFVALIRHTHQRIQTNSYTF